MNISETPDNEFTLPNSAASGGANIRFVKNEQGQRVAKELSDSEIEAMKEKREIGVIIVGHIGHTQGQIIRILNGHEFTNFKGNVVLVANTEDMIPGMPVALGLEYLHEKIQEMDREKPFLIKKISRDDLPEISLEEKKYAHKKFNPHYVPKTQKSKAVPTKKYRQKNK